MQLPIFPSDSVEINNELAFKKENGAVTYFNGCMPIFSHDENDLKSFRMIMSQFYVNGNATQAELSRAFGVTKINIKRAVKLYREKGINGFYSPRTQRGATVLTPAVLADVQSRLDNGESVSDIAIHLELKKNTLSKAIQEGRLRNTGKKKDPGIISPEITTKSTRTEQDTQAPFGVATTDVLGRLATSLGKFSSVSPVFTAAVDIPYGGVLLAIPALLACGLLSKVNEYFELPPGYYSLQSIFLLLALMALARIKTVEDLKYCAPGEWGKLIGLDRIPEIRTLRDKLITLTQDGEPEKWSAWLCQQWMNSNTEACGVFYVDGHVRVYHGDQTKLPRHYVTREKLCLRATVDYWVNALDGQPFFFVNKAVDPGLIQVLEHEIVPRIEQDSPDLVDKTALEQDPLLHKYTFIFDREGYSPDLLKRLKTRRIACTTYHKHPKEDWPLTEFSTQVLEGIAGNQVTVQLAERGTLLSNKLWVREIRRLSSTGHQTSIITTDYKSDFKMIGLKMANRWCQENFFKYMRQHYNLDRLVDYSLEAIPDTTMVINPVYRTLDGLVRKLAAKLSRALAEFASMHLEDNIEPDKVAEYELKKSKWLEGIQDMEKAMIQAKQARKEARKHIPIHQLPEEERFKRLSQPRKHFLDTIKMIAYRAETAMTNVVQLTQIKPDERRSFLRSIYQMEADLIPDGSDQTLTVKLHHLANHASDKALEVLCNELNETNTIFPGTALRIIYKLGTS